MAVLTSSNVTNNSGAIISAVAWIDYTGTASTIRKSYNVSSYTRTSTGLYTFGFTTALPSNYTISGWSRFNGNSTGNSSAITGQSNLTKTTTSLQVSTTNTSGNSRQDCAEGCVVLFS
jgi:hypothetical protein